jgi:hypothetical protein
VPQNKNKRAKRCYPLRRLNVKNYTAENTAKEGKIMDFTGELQKILAEAKQKGLTSILVNAGDLHRRAGEYPGPNHRMPMCCSAMRKMMKDGDSIVKSPPLGNGASLTIEYQLSGVKHIEDHSNIEETEKMNKFAKAAIKAVRLYREKTKARPYEAWQEAINGLSESASVREKSCPRNTFLGLCSDGFITGIQAGEYTTSVERTYARKAVEILRKNPSLADYPCKLWIEIGNDGKSCDSQMEIVIALWNEGAILRNFIRYTTYENRSNPHITIHVYGCNQIAKNGGSGIGDYHHYNTLGEAEVYAETTGLPVIHCSFCKPR